MWTASLFFGSIRRTASRRIISGLRPAAAGRFLPQARVARVPGVFLLLPFLAGKDDFFGVEHDDVIAGVDMRGIGRACLPISTIANWLASRPTTLPDPSTTHHFCSTSPGLAMYVLVDIVVIIQSAAGSRFLGFLGN